MKFIHLSDLHLGKRFNEFSMMEDQDYILREICKIIEYEQPQGVIIAGDIYDRTVPSAEAVQKFDDFLYWLASRSLQVFIISGNHDSPERIAFGGRLMDLSGVHMSPVYKGAVEPIVMNDQYGELAVYMLPFIKPATVRRFFPDDEIVTYTDAVGAAVSHMNIDPKRRSILVTHQFVTGAERSDSEDISVGGTDNVDVSVFEPFDYVALGHLHGPQSVERDTVRYCGTPLKYSFSEKDHIKSVTVVDFGEKGEVSVRTVPLKPKHDVRELRGTYYDLMLKDNYEDTATDDYLRIVLTDEEDVPDAMRKLQTVYPNLMQLSFDNTRTQTANDIFGAEDIECKTEIDLFEELFKLQNGQPMSDEQRDFATLLFEQIKEEAK